MSECLVYQLRTGKTLVGRLDSEKGGAIKLSGDNILEEHCVFDNSDNKVTLTSFPSSITVSSLCCWCSLSANPSFSPVPQRQADNAGHCGCSILES